MLKFLFWTLLLANGALAAYQFGYLEALVPNGHEPTRLDQQIAPERIRIVPPPLEPPAAQVEARVAPALAATEPGAPTCIEIGNFNPEEARLFIAALGELGSRASPRSVQEVASHMVYLPPHPNREAAERKVAELRRLGVEDSFIIQDNSSLRWAISLGVFKTEAGARAGLQRLNDRGVRNARIGQRMANSGQQAFQFRGLDANARRTLDQVKVEFGPQEVRACAPA